MIKRVSAFIIQGMELDAERLIQDSFDQLGELFD